MYNNQMCTCDTSDTEGSDPGYGDSNYAALGVNDCSCGRGLNGNINNDPNLQMGFEPTQNWGQQNEGYGGPCFTPNIEAVPAARVSQSQRPPMQEPRSSVRNGPLPGCTCPTSRQSNSASAVPPPHQIDFPSERTFTRPPSISQMRGPNGSPASPEYRLSQTSKGGCGPTTDNNVMQQVPPTGYVRSSQTSGLSQPRMSGTNQRLSASGQPNGQGCKATVCQGGSSGNQTPRKASQTSAGGQSCNVQPNQDLLLPQQGQSNGSNEPCGRRNSQQSNEIRLSQQGLKTPQGQKNGTNLPTQDPRCSGRKSDSSQQSNEIRLSQQGLKNGTNLPPQDPKCAGRKSDSSQQSNEMRLSQQGQGNDTTQSGPRTSSITQQWPQQVIAPCCMKQIVQPPPPPPPPEDNCAGAGGPCFCPTNPIMPQNLQSSEQGNEGTDDCQTCGEFDTNVSNVESNTASCTCGDNNADELPPTSNEVESPPAENLENGSSKGPGFMQQLQFQICQGVGNGNDYGNGNNIGQVSSVHPEANNGTPPAESCNDTTDVTANDGNKSNGKTWQQLTLDIYQTHPGGSFGSDGGDSQGGWQQQLRLMIYQETIADGSGNGVSDNNATNASNEADGCNGNENDFQAPAEEVPLASDCDC